MILIAATFALLTVANLAASEDALTIEKCTCGPGFKPHKNDDGGIVCAGINVYTSLPCNTPTAPTCKCTGDVTSIVIDELGTWCTLHDNKEEKKWACENKEEWTDFTLKRN